MDEKKIKIRQFRKKLDTIINIIKNLPDSELPDFLYIDDFEKLIKAFFNAKKIKKDEKIAEFLLKNKNRSQSVASIRRIIDLNCVLKKKIKDKVGVVSPNYIQWYDDGVMFLENSENKFFEGYIGLYQDGQAKYAVAAKDIGPGANEVYKDDLLFISIEDFNKGLLELNKRKKIDDLEKAVNKLIGYLKKGDNEEKNIRNL